MSSNNACNFNEGTTGQILTSNGEGLPPTFQDNSGGSVDSTIFRSTIDFTGYNSGSFQNWIISAGSESHEVGHPGIVSIANNNEIYCRYFDTSSGDFEAIAVIFQEYLPSSGDYIVIGLNDSPTMASSVDNGIYFRLQNGDTSWTACTENGGVVTATPTGVVSGAASWQNLKLVVEDSGATAKFYIDGVLKATNTTNMPSTTTGLYYSATANGVYVNKTYIDLLDISQTLTR